MLKREQLINKLRELGYKFKRQADRVEIYGKGTSRVLVPRRDLISITLARALLHGAGVSEAEIVSFLRACGN